MTDDNSGEQPSGELAEIRQLVEANTGLTRQVLDLTGDVRLLTEQVHRLAAELVATVGQAASKAVLASWERDVVAALGVHVEARYPGGIHGTLGVRTEGGELRVLKVLPPERQADVRRAVAIAGRLRTLGVPVPDPYLVGTAAGRVFTLQERCPGVVAQPFRVDHARAALKTWELHVGACPEGGAWPEAVGRALTAGDPSLWVDHRPVRAVGGRAAALLDEIVRVGRSFDLRCLAATDAVHLDWHHRNVLVDGGTVTAVVDWETACPGDARFDLVTQAFWSEVHRGSEVDEAAADEIAAFVADRVDADVRAGLSALLAAQQLTFTADQRPDLLARMVGHVDRLLAPRWSSPT